MDMVRHTFNLKYLMFIALDYSCQVLMEALFPTWVDLRLSEFHRKNQMNVDLCVGVWHG